MTKQLSPLFLEVNESTSTRSWGDALAGFPATQVPNPDATRIINIFDVASARAHNAQWTALETKSSGQVFLKMPEVEWRQMLASKGLMIGKAGK